MVAHNCADPFAPKRAPCAGNGLKISLSTLPGIFPVGSSPNLDARGYPRGKLRGTRALLPVQNLRVVCR